MKLNVKYETVRIAIDRYFVTLSCAISLIFLFASTPIFFKKISIINNGCLKNELEKESKLQKSLSLASTALIGNMSLVPFKCYIRYFYVINLQRVRVFDILLIAYKKFNHR